MTNIPSFSPNDVRVLFERVRPGQTTSKILCAIKTGRPYLWQNGEVKDATGRFWIPALFDGARLAGSAKEVAKKKCISYEEALDLMVRFHSGLGKSVVSLSIFAPVEIDHLSRAEQEARYADLSAATGMKWALSVFSGNKSVHNYLAFTAAITGQDIRREQIQKLLVVGLEGDTHITDPGRLMRMPGYMGEDRQQPILSIDQDAHYEVDDIIRRLTTYAGSLGITDIDRAYRALQMAENLCSAAKPEHTSDSERADEMREHAAHLRKNRGSVSDSDMRIGKLLMPVLQSSCSSSTSRSGGKVVYYPADVLKPFQACQHGTVVSPPCCPDQMKGWMMSEAGESPRIYCNKHGHTIRTERGTTPDPVVRQRTPIDFEDVLASVEDASGVTWVVNGKEWEQVVSDGRKYQPCPWCNRGDSQALVYSAVKGTAHCKWERTTRKLLKTLPSVALPGYTLVDDALRDTGPEGDDTEYLQARHWAGFLLEDKLKPIKIDPDDIPILEEDHVLFGMEKNIAVSDRLLKSRYGAEVGRWISCSKAPYLCVGSGSSNAGRYLERRGTCRSWSCEDCGPHLREALRAAVLGASIELTFGSMDAAAGTAVVSLLDEPATNVPGLPGAVRGDRLRGLKTRSLSPRTSCAVLVRSSAGHETLRKVLCRHVDRTHGAFQWLGIQTSPESISYIFFFAADGSGDAPEESTLWCLFDSEAPMPGRFDRLVEEVFETIDIDSWVFAIAKGTSKRISLLAGPSTLTSKITDVFNWLTGRERVQRELSPEEKLQVAKDKKMSKDMNKKEEKENDKKLSPAELDEKQKKVAADKAAKATAKMRAKNKPSDPQRYGMTTYKPSEVRAVISEAFQQEVKLVTAPTTPRNGEVVSSINLPSSPGPLLREAVKSGKLKSCSGHRRSKRVDIDTINLNLADSQPTTEPKRSVK